MAELIAPDELAGAIEEALTIYSEELEEEIEQITKASAADLAKRTRATAPVGRRGKFKKSIAYKKLPTLRGSKYVWYVRAPDYRLTHLVVHGHQSRNGGRTRGNPFLKNALDVVLREYEEKIKEAIRRG